ncbi:AI-2E family transporter [Sesbania bispinosa]|nr:AI-2E family transporter [Sesbania bispinosa]
MNLSQARHFVPLPRLSTATVIQPSLPSVVMCPSPPHAHRKTPRRLVPVTVASTVVVLLCWLQLLLSHSLL